MCSSLVNDKKIVIELYFFSQVNMRRKRRQRSGLKTNKTARDKTADNDDVNKCLFFIIVA